MCGDIAVLIPHFQRTPGVLARTLAAVFAQDCSERLTVVIVDDESPVPAAAELGGLDDTARAAIRLIRRKNGGPAAAKNTGLAIIPDSIAYIALLDCDDIWSPGHLSRGMNAMRLGFDLFFCDHRREGSDISQFARCGIDRSEHRLVDSDNDIYAWGTDLFDTCLRSSVIGLSTVLLRRTAFPGLKFAEDAGFADDILFALDAAHGTAKVAFTFSEDVFYTTADNASIITEWYSNKSLKVILTLSLCYHKTLSKYAITEAQREFLNRRIRETRQDFATTVVGLLFRGRKIDSEDLMRFFDADKALLAEIARTIFKILRKRLLGQA